MLNLSPVAGALRGAESTVPPATSRLAALGLMTAGAIHDLGNIVQVLASGVQLVARHPKVTAEAPLQAVVADLGTSVERAADMLHQLLAFTRQGNAGVEHVTVDVCVADLARVLRWAAGDNVRLAIDIGENLPPVLCSRSLFENALLNLVLNARDAMPRGGALFITASACLNGGGASGIRLEVADTGVGMSRDTALRAFEPFFTTKADGLGNGLGLAAVRSFAEQAGGCVTIDSAPGTGTKITLRLPAAPTRRKVRGDGEARDY